MPLFALENQKKRGPHFNDVFIAVIWNQTCLISKVCLYSSILSVSSSQRNLRQSLLTCFSLVFFAPSSPCMSVMLDILFACLLCQIFCPEGLDKALVVLGGRGPWLSWTSVDLSFCFLFTPDLSSFGVHRALSSAQRSSDQRHSILSSPESKPLVSCQDRKEAVGMINRQVQQHSLSRSQREMCLTWLQSQFKS